MLAAGLCDLWARALLYIFSWRLKLKCIIITDLTVLADFARSIDGFRFPPAATRQDREEAGTLSIHWQLQQMHGPG